MFQKCFKNTSRMFQCAWWCISKDWYSKECILIHIGAYGCIWMHMDAYGCIWMHMNEYECIIMHIGSLWWYELFKSEIESSIISKFSIRCKKCLTVSQSYLRVVSELSQICLRVVSELTRDAYSCLWMFMSYLWVIYELFMTYFVGI
jgi:hypothetical protein